MCILKNAQQFLSIDSESRKGNEEAINYLIPFFEKLNGKVIIQQLPHSVEGFSKRQFNIIGIIGDTLVDPSTPRGILLVSHIDTSAPGLKEYWSELNGSPFNAKTDSEFLYGLGAAGAKSDFLCKLRACENFKKFEVDEPIYLVATCGGESSLSGIKYLRESGAVNPKYVFVGHPTAMKVQTVNKGRLILDCCFQFLVKDRDLRSYNTRVSIFARARPENIAYVDVEFSAMKDLVEVVDFLTQHDIKLKLIGLNSDQYFNKTVCRANIDLVVHYRDIEKFRQKFRTYINQNPDKKLDIDVVPMGNRGAAIFHEDCLKSVIRLFELIDEINKDLRQKQDDRFSPPCSTARVSRFSSNKNRLYFYLDFSLLPELLVEDDGLGFERKIKNECLEKLRATSQSIVFSIRRHFYQGAFLTDYNSEFYQRVNNCAERANIELMQTFGSLSTAASYFNSEGTQVVVFGAGDPVNDSQNANEKVKILDLEASTRFYMEVIDEFAIKKRKEGR